MKGCCSFFFCLDTKEKEPKKKRSRAGACVATSSPLFADGAITRFAQTVAPSLRLPAIPLTPLRQGSFYATSLRSFFLFALLRFLFCVTALYSYSVQLFQLIAPCRYSAPLYCTIVLHTCFVQQLTNPILSNSFICFYSQ